MESKNKYPEACKLYVIKKKDPKMLVFQRNTVAVFIIFLVFCFLLWSSQLLEILYLKPHSKTYKESS